MNAQLDIEPFLYRSGMTVRAVLERFNTASLPIGCVIDADRRVIGTVTDGDIRRGILRGVSLDDTVDDCMNRSPHVVRDGEPVPTGVARYDFVPVLDREGRLVRLHIPSQTIKDRGPCLIMAGGFGSRMGDITRETPKPLLPLDGEPILEHILKRLELSDHRTVFVSTFYLSEKIETFIEGRGGPAEVSVLREPTKLGTAGAISLLPDGIAEPLVVMNGDVVTQIDLRAFRDYHDRHDLDATIAVARYEHNIPFGVVRQRDDGLFDGIEEKPTIGYFVSAGIYCLEATVRELVPKGQPMDMPELLNEARGLGLRIGLFPIHEYWKDVGRPSDLSSARTSHNSHDAS